MSPDGLNTFLFTHVAGEEGTAVADARGALHDALTGRLERFPVQTIGRTMTTGPCVLSLRALRRV